MWRLAARELRGQWRLTALISCGLILGALAYISLLGTASGTTTVLTGDIGKAWNTPYDLLVRPSGEVSRLERTRGLVSPNFLSSINGGITDAQLSSIRKITGVSVAAPIAIVGYTTLDYQFTVPDLAALLGSRPITVLRLAGTATAEEGLAHYPLAPAYFVFAPHGTLTISSPSAYQLTYDGQVIPCNNSTVICEVGTTGTVICTACSGSTAFPNTAYLTIPIPIMIAGIDPRAESKLSRINKFVTAGHFLPSGGKLKTGAQNLTQIPLIVSTQSFISENLRIEVDAMTDPLKVIDGLKPASATGWSPVYQTSTSVQSLYAKEIARQGSIYSDRPNLVVPGEVHYRVTSPSEIRAISVPTEATTLANPNCLNCMTEDVPPDATDTWYRSLSVESANQSALYRFDEVGQYNASRLPGFNVLAGGNLSAFAPPEALLPRGKSLLPTRNPAGFITSPPLVLTTLAAAQYLADNYSSGAGSAFISAVRIQVRGTSKPSNAAQARLSAVAQAIEHKTGLLVSLVKGSSALPIRVSLAKGKFGTPALTVTEYWGKEGAAIAFLRGVDIESLVLFSLTLGVVLVLLGVIGQLAARRRSRDFALLRALGWPLAHVVRLAVIEMVLLGAAVGVATSILAVAVTRAVDPAIPILPLVAVVPLVVAMSVLAPLPGLIGSARSPVAGTLRRAGRIGGIRVRSVRTLALRDLVGPWRLESLLCLGSSMIGSGLVGGVVLIVGGFAGHLGPTTLGRDLANQVGPLDLAMIAIAIVAGTAASGTLLSLAYLERQVEFSTLRALGWPWSAVAQVVAIQALTLGVGGGLMAAALVAVGGLAIGAPLLITVAGPLLSIGVAVATAGLAMAATVSLTYRLRPAAALRAA